MARDRDVRPHRIAAMGPDHEGLVWPVRKLLLQHLAEDTRRLAHALHGLDLLVRRLQVLKCRWVHAHGALLLALTFRCSRSWAAAFTGSIRPRASRGQSLTHAGSISIAALMSSSGMRR